MEENRKLMIVNMIAILKDIKATLYALEENEIAENLSFVIMQLEHTIQA